MADVNCPYCGNVAGLVTGEALYPLRADLWSKLFYLCVPCYAYVGCHKGTGRPLGRLADAVLRSEKMKAHAAFDPFWRGRMSRGEAYRWLATALGIDRRDCHIGMFDVERCQEVVRVVRRAEAELAANAERAVSTAASAAKTDV